MTEWKNAALIEILAMAYAETNDFVAALNWQTKALALYSDDKKKAAAETRLRL